MNDYTMKISNRIVRIHKKGKSEWFLTIFIDKQLSMVANKYGNGVPTQFLNRMYDCDKEFFSDLKQFLSE